MKNIVPRLWIGPWLLLLAACGEDAAPPERLVETQVEPPGEHCAAGGLAIERGTDRDGDGVLAGDEIEERTYVCGPRVLVREDAIAPGGACPGGGAAVHTGFDDDGDGVLDDDEIERTTTVCDPSEIWHGDLLTTRAADLAALADVRVITGSLVTSPDVVGVQAPNLALIGGQLAVSTASTLELPALAQAGAVALVEGTLAAPQLATIGGDLTTSFHATALDLPALTRVTGGVALGGQALASLHAPALATIGADLGITHTTLGAVALPALVEVGGDIDIRHAALTAFAAPVLVTIGGDSVTVASCSQLASLGLPAVERISAQLDLVELPALTSLAIGVKYGWRIRVAGVGLAQLAFPRLIDAFTIAINDAPALAAIELPVLQDLDTLLVGLSLSTPAPELPALTALRAPVMHTVRRLAIDGAPQLVELALLPPAAIDTVTIQRAGLANLAALHATQTIGALYVSDCPQLVGLGIQPLSLRALELRNNPLLASLAGLERLHHIPGDLRLATLPALTDLTGLHNVVAIGDDLEIRKNAGLANLAALSNLAAIGGDLTLRFNPALTSIGGLDALTQLGGDLLVLENVLVPPAEIAALRARLGF